MLEILVFVSANIIFGINISIAILFEFSDVDSTRSEKLKSVSKLDKCGIDRNIDGPEFNVKLSVFMLHPF